MATKLITQKAVSTETAMSIRTIRNYTNRRIIPCYRIGGKMLRYDLDEVLEALQRYHVPSKHSPSK